MFANFFHNTNQKSNHTGASLQGERFWPSPLKSFEHHFSPPGSPLHSIVSIFIWPQAYQSICIATKVLTYFSTNSQPSSRLPHFSNSFSAGRRPAKHTVTRVSTCTFFLQFTTTYLIFPSFKFLPQ